ncbi:hypothetical protein F7725_020051 [Dissostichus mawsoni]|uniref:IRG-type G domain-containing protein n=1 Tax=Dissostichus mawsoni TaxID=36200 RepID=A0A7J5YLG3_DISMA|nr:hypothetical protein F7725_020051 [Dissostichus mawsoni]
MIAKAIRDMKKRFYFVRSKIDQDIFNTKEVKESSTQKRPLPISGTTAFKVFLVSSFDLQLYDFHLLEETLGRELPEHKRDTLLLALPNFNLGIIKKKKEALQSKVVLCCFICTHSSCTSSWALHCCRSNHAVQNAFGLDPKSLQSLAVSACVPLEDLTAEMKSPLAVKEIRREVILNLLQVSTVHVALMVAEEGFRYIPLFGIPLASSLSFACTYRALSTFLYMLAEDAQSVFTKALGLHTSV